MPTIRFRIRWLDRLWLIAIACSFLLLAPIYVILSIGRFGWQPVAVFAVVMLAGIIRHRSDKSAASDPSEDRAP